MTDIVTQAAEWLVKFSCEEQPPSSEEREAFDRWRESDPRHAAAVDDMESIVGRLKALPAEPAASTLAASDVKRRNQSWTTLAKTLCFVVCLIFPLWLLSPQNSLEGLLADISTSTGEWKTHVLSDNSRLELGSNSAVNIVFTQGRRTVELVKGEIFVDVAKDKTSPFVIETTQGKLAALGTRFIVRQQAGRTTLSVLESKVRVQLKDETVTGNVDIIVGPGQRVVLHKAQIDELETFNAQRYEEAWLSRQLVVQGKPLSDVLVELTPFYNGYLEYKADELVDMQVYAVLPLDKPERALDLLSESFPIEVHRFTPWWTSIQRQD